MTCNDLVFFSLPAFVAGEQSGLILEKRFLMGETLKGDSYLDIEAELSLADKKKRELRAEDATEEAEKLAMKELGIKRFDPYLCSSSLLSTIDSVLIGYAKGTITCFFGDLDIIMDVVRSRLGTKLPPTLRMAMKKDDAEAKMFDFDPKHIDWEDYFSSIHIPGVMKYAFK
ncbi:hypothetical protein BHM03_00036832 [Ensete ventricosum]|nr:hypothetical protein BHM03_00036832 [Ensete ventricosum]